MADEPRVQKLLDELLDSDCTPEEVCVCCPELLPVVRQRWQQIRLVDAEIEALFPTPRAGAAAEKPIAVHDLPRIAGFDVLSILGRGGMGVVYMARDLRLHRPVALKMLLAGSYATADDRERFLREAEAVASLRHANIVQVYGAGEHEGRPYFTMEYVEGGSLAQRWQGTPQPAAPTAALVATLAEAVHVAHEGDIVHRDLKPANILLTADGTPKIADFGLARHFHSSPALTRSGAPLGTPSYMAPEQARGKTRLIGPATDVYALGAILYECLTGRPPFCGETASETVLQVLEQEPLPPTRLNPKVPRDLETICLMCLHKEPLGRYATAAALAADLHRFERGEPIAARPAGWLERAGKRVRRYPVLSATLAASVLLALLLTAAVAWLAVQQAQRREGVEADLRELAGLQDSAKWVEARAVLDRAEARLAGSDSGDLRQRLGQARRALDLVIQLDGIRLRRATRGELAFYKTQAHQAYADAFAKAGLGALHDDPQRVAACVNGSAVRGAVVSALYDWVICTPHREQRAWLLAVARRLDAEPDVWRQRVFDAPLWEDKEALGDLAQSAPVAHQPLALLLSLAEQLRSAGGDSVAFLRLVQREHPADFWANLILGNALLVDTPQKAVGAYRAALASRPGAAVGYCAVGDALRLHNDLPTALGYYEKALQLDPGYARAHNNLGLLLQAQGQTTLAISHHQKAVELDPDYVWAHHDLGNALRATGRLDEACMHFEEALKRDPANIEIQNAMRGILVRAGRGSDVQAAWRRLLNADPPEHDVWFGYAELCLYLGQIDEYRWACRAMLARFGATTSPYIGERVGRACLLLPGPPDELKHAFALTGRAVAARKSTPAWIYAYFRFARGLAEYRVGHWRDAIAIMKYEAAHVMGPCPRLVVAMAEHRSGQAEAARTTLAAALDSYDWSPPQADNRDAWIAHILRREAVALIQPNTAGDSGDPGP